MAIQPFQILLHIQILHFVRHLSKAAVNHIFARDRAEAMLGHSAFFLVDQVMNLFGNDLRTVLNLIDLAKLPKRFTRVEPILHFLLAINAV